MKSSGKDPILFKTSKNKPVSHVTVPAPGAFTISGRGGDAVSAIIGDCALSQDDRITIRTRRGMTSFQDNEQRQRIAARNHKAILKHTTKNSHASTSGARSVSHQGSTGARPAASRGAATSSACLSATSQKSLKERELATKLEMLRRLREKDVELSEAAELATALLHRQGRELRASQRQGLHTLAAVQRYLSSTPALESLSREGESSAAEDRGDSSHRAAVQHMMKGTAAVELKPQPLSRVVVSRKLSRRKSVQLEKSLSLGQDNLRCDAQLSAVFLHCMYTEDEEDSDEEPGGRGGKENREVFAQHSNSSAQAPPLPLPPPPPPPQSTCELVQQCAVPPWETSSSAGNTRVTLGAKQARPRRLEDRVLEALELARGGNKQVRNNALRTHFGEYDDSDEDEELRPVLRGEQFAALYFQPFGDAFVSTARPPVSALDDEGADFFDSFNAREGEEQQTQTQTQQRERDALQAASSPANATPKKFSGLGSLFSAMTALEEEGDDWAGEDC